jgi:hypothetical protein
MTEKIYKDPFTLDGRVKAVKGVTEDKAEAVTQLLDETMSGNRMSRGVLEEALSSTDAIFNFAHVTQLTVLDDFPELPRNAQELGATTLTVADFRPATLYSLRPDWTSGGTLTAHGEQTPRYVAPRIPEAANYPYAYLEQEVSQQQGGIVKRGFKTGFTFEAFINDSIGFIQALPQAMTDIALDTDEWEIWNALISGVDDDQQLQGGPVPYGEDTATVAPNAPISRNALVRAMIELGERTINDRKVIVSGGYKLVIPAGQRLWVEYILNNVVGPIGYESGSFDFTIQGYNPLAGLTIIESEFTPDNSWYLIPNANQARRPLLQLLRLAGHELPELRVQGNTGSYEGGGAVSPFEGSFDNDTADFRLRLFTKGILWTPDLVIWSDGSGVA